MYATNEGRKGGRQLGQGRQGFEPEFSLSINIWRSMLISGSELAVVVLGIGSCWQRRYAVAGWICQGDAYRSVCEVLLALSHGYQFVQEGPLGSRPIALTVGKSYLTSPSLLTLTGYSCALQLPSRARPSPCVTFKNRAYLSSSSQTVEASTNQHEFKI
jgi:hypothetical protein